MSAPKRIGKIKFGILSPKELRKMSVTKIITADTYDDDGYPIDMGLMDQRLGVIDPGLRCKTCGGRPGECPGHFGHIELVAPIIHVGYAKFIGKILKSICKKCGHVLLSEEDKKEYLEKIQVQRESGQSFDDIVKEIFKTSGSLNTCPYCGEINPVIKFEKPTGYIEDDHRLTSIEIRDRFERIPDEDIELFGMDKNNAKPAWLILTVLPVPPVTTRPSITLESGQRSEDDLTHKLVDIIRINQRWRTKMRGHLN